MLTYTSFPRKQATARSTERARDTENARSEAGVRSSCLWQGELGRRRRQSTWRRRQRRGNNACVERTHIQDHKLGRTNDDRLGASVTNRVLITSGVLS